MKAISGLALAIRFRRRALSAIVPLWFVITAGEALLAAAPAPGRCAWWSRGDLLWQRASVSRTAFAKPSIDRLPRFRRC